MLGPGLEAALDGRIDLVIMETDFGGYPCQLDTRAGRIEQTIGQELPKLERSPIQGVVPLGGRCFPEPIQLTPARRVRKSAGAIDVCSGKLMYGWFFLDAVCGLGCTDQVDQPIWGSSCLDLPQSPTIPIAVTCP